MRKNKYELVNETRTLDASREKKTASYRYSDKTIIVIYPKKRLATIKKNHLQAL